MEKDHATCWHNSETGKTFQIRGISHRLTVTAFTWNHQRFLKPELMIERDADRTRERRSKEKKMKWKGKKKNPTHTGKTDGGREKKSHLSEQLQRPEWDTSDPVPLRLGQEYDEAAYDYHHLAQYSSGDCWSQAAGLRMLCTPQRVCQTKPRWGPEGVPPTLWCWWEHGCMKMLHSKTVCWIALMKQQGTKSTTNNQ